MTHSDKPHKCICSRAADKQNILLKITPAGNSGQTLLTSHFIIVVIEGRARYKIMGATVVVEPGELIFLPASTTMCWEALEDCTVLMFRLNDLIGKIPECRTFRFHRQGSDAALDHDFGKGIHPLRVNHRMKPFIDDVVAMEREGLRCDNYATHVVAILLARIQFFYPPEEYLRFYATVASCDVVFSDTVYDRWRECRTVAELAGALNTTVRRFTSHFHRAFGESPGTWLKERRREQIYRDICSSSMPLGEIAIKNGVSLTNLVRYSRTNFGDTPSRIRASLTRAMSA